MNPSTWQADQSTTAAVPSSAAPIWISVDAGAGTAVGSGGAGGAVGAGGAAAPGTLGCGGAAAREGWGSVLEEPTPAGSGTTPARVPGRADAEPVHDIHRIRAR